MATYLDMQNRIADELDRTDLTTQIKKAIVSAVQYYERRRFYFGESSFTFTTVQGQRTYTSADAAAIATAPNIERINGLYYSTRMPLTKVDFQDIDTNTTMLTSYAQPEDWAYRNLTIWLYPIPDNAYVMTCYHIPRLTTLSSDSTSNVWTNDAEELIRTRAKIDLMMNVIRGPEMVEELTLLKLQERDCYTALIEETASREATGMAQPTEF